MMSSSSYSGTEADPLTLVDKLVAYLPAFVLPDPATGPLSYEGATLWAAFEGFTALAESLAKTGREGVEVLTRVLNSYLSPLFKLVEQHEGLVVGFDGTSLQVFFPAGPVAALDRAEKAGQALIDISKSFVPVQTAEGRYSFQTRVGVAAGKLERLTVGSDIVGRVLVFHGPALEQANLAQESIAWGQLARVAVPSSQAVSGEDESLTAPKVLKNEDPLSVFSRLSPYLPRPLAQRLKSGANMTANNEFPRVVNIFVRLAGVNLSQPDFVAKLSEYYQAVQRICAELDGRVHDIIPLPAEEAVYLHLTFGALLSNNEDATHALRTALKIRNLPTPAGELPTLGVASGTVFSGSVGTNQHQSYIVLGEVVNLSARFARAAHEAEAPGTILVDRYTRERVGLAFLFGEDLGLDLPGRNYPVKVSHLLASRPTTGALPTFLREHPTGTNQTDHNLLNSVMQGQRRVHLSQDPGEVALIAQQWLQQGGQGATGGGMLNATNVPYLAWSGILGGLFGLSDTESRTEKAAKLSQAVALYAPSFTNLTGWLSQLVGLAQEEPGFRQRISGPQQPQFAELVLALLRGMADTRPVLLIFQDLQWSDEASLALLEQAVRDLSTSPLLFCLNTQGPPGPAIKLLADLPGMSS